MMKRLTKAKMVSITRVLFILGAVSSVVWISISYAIAIYSTVKLGQVYTMSELSEPAMTVFLGTIAAKTMENIFEHNESVIFGTCKKETKKETNESEGEVV
jgi:ABC-type anion transport system duplicated permease subunit